MSSTTPHEVRPGQAVVAADGGVIGVVDAAFADYVLVRTRGLLPIDLYVPVGELTVTAGGPHRAQIERGAARERWHRPLKKAPHEPRD